MRNGTFMLRQMAFSSKRYCTTLTSEWSLEEMNVDMQPQVTFFCILTEHFIAHSTNTPAILHNTVTKVDRLNSYNILQTYSKI